MTVVATRHGDDVFVSWSSRSPKFERYKLVVQSLRVRKFDHEVKAWRLPYSIDILERLQTLLGSDLTLDGDLAADLARDTAGRAVALQAKTTGDADLGGFVPRLEPWPHQRAAVAAALNQDAYALFWEMGTGKTKGSIDTVLAKKAGDVLVLCPNDLLYNWQDEIKLHAGEDALILDDSLADRRESLKRARNSRFVVHNAESLPAMVDDLLKRRWDAVIVDEATTFKNPDAQRTKALMELARVAKFRQPMTGTPVTQHIYDLYAPMNFMRPGIFGAYGYFRWRYFELVWDKVLRKEVLRPRKDNLGELLRLVDETSYRVTKKEVLPWLPEKLPPQMRYVTLAPEQDAAYREMRRRYKVFLQTLTGPVMASAPQIVTQLMRLSEITSGFLRNEMRPGEVHWFPNHAKGRVIDDITDELMEDGKKHVIFSAWRPECEHYGARYEKYGSAVIFGGMQPRDRQAIVRLFQNEEEPRVLVAQIGSGGRGINLTAAATATYASRDYSLEHWLQSQDRLHRAGQKMEVNLIVVRGLNTADDHQEAILSGKADLADIVTRDRER